jgi:hypothetical protein
MGLGHGAQRRSLGIYLATALIAGALIPRIGYQETAVSMVICGLLLTLASANPAHLQAVSHVIDHPAVREKPEVLEDHAHCMAAQFT